MSVITMIREIKQVHPKEIVLVKIGDFYHVYGRDSYILSYLFGYKINLIDDKYSTCGFPTKSLNKIEVALENKKINYMLIDRRNNYDVDGIIDNKNLNTYDEFWIKSQKYINTKNRIDKIHAILMNNINSKDVKIQIQQIEKILKEEKQ